MPSFRGEDADDTHLNQFFHSEAEVPGDLAGVMSLVEEYLRELTQAALTVCAPAIRDLGVSCAHLERLVETSEIDRITFDEASALLGDDPESIRQEEGWRTLTRRGEQRLLAEFAPILWVTHFDHLAVPFYQRFADDSGAKAVNADLLLGPGELVGAGERHENDAALREALVLHDVDPRSYAWYVEMKRSRPMRTSGFGLGVERWMQWVLQMPDIRDVQLVPRVKGMSLTP